MEPWRERRFVRTVAGVSGGWGGRLPAVVLAFCLVLGGCTRSTAPRTPSETAPSSPTDAPPETKLPLLIPKERGFIVRDAPVGDRFTDGFEMLRIRSGNSIRVEKIETVGGSPGLRQIGVLLAGDSRKFITITSAPDFPPRARHFGPLVRAAGRAIAARPRHWQLLIGYTVVRPGVWRRSGIRVTYRHRGGVHSAVLPARLVVCTKSARKCPTIEEASGR